MLSKVILVCLIAAAYTEDKKEKEPRAPAYSSQSVVRLDISHPVKVTYTHKEKGDKKEHKETKKEDYGGYSEKPIDSGHHETKHNHAEQDFPENGHHQFSLGLEHQNIPAGHGQDISPLNHGYHVYHDSPFGQTKDVPLSQELYEINQSYGGQDHFTSHKEIHEFPQSHGHQEISHGQDISHGHHEILHNYGHQDVTLGHNQQDVAENNKQHGIFHSQAQHEISHSYGHQDISLEQSQDGPFSHSQHETSKNNEHHDPPHHLASLSLGRYRDVPLGHHTISEGLSHNELPHNNEHNFGSIRHHPSSLHEESSGTINYAESSKEPKEEHHLEYFAHPKYEYEYQIKDPHTGDNKFQHETRDGDDVKGVYSLHDSDGSIRTVKYSASKNHGFSAVVQTEKKH